ncbi:MAG: hypothetical protein RLZZ292_2703 [Bacteroidota bacterium]|jgi:predicted ATP-dependent endonuclease of OLD family
MRIKKLILNNFRQFGNLELDFTDENGKVLDVVVFAGVNGSGKSTILQFLADCANCCNNDFSALEWINDIDFSISLSNCEDIYFVRNFKEEQNKQQRIELLREQFLKINQISSTEFIWLRDRGCMNSSLLEGVIDFDITQYNILKKIQSIVFKDKHQAPYTVIQNTINSINDALKILKTNTRLIDIESERLVFSNGLKNDLTFDNLSNGEKQLFFQIFTLYNLHLKNGILLIDEPEDAMHPTWQSEILNVYKNIGIDNQVFVATHSPHILSSVKPESLFVLNIEQTTSKIEAFNMAKERKNTKGLDPNRILTEIMGAPLRDYKTQQRIDNLSALIKAANAAPNGNIQTIEEDLQTLTIDFGRQDYNVMLFNNELMLLKRKKSKIQMV